MLPPSLSARLAALLGATPTDVRPLGPMIARATIGRHHCVVKWAATDGAPAGRLDACTAEARGLQLLAATGALRVPQVQAQAEASSGCPAFLVLEWIDSAAVADAAVAGAALGAGLAALHRQSAPAYGLDHDNYCGPTPQLNTWRHSWLDFYRDCRLVPQVEQAQRAGRLSPARHRGLQQLVDHLDRWLDPCPEPPALIHGDLWSGNWLIDSVGNPVLIDPAVSYSHREAELAMCRLFGGFPAAFFAAYDAAWPPAHGRDDRLPLYQLYHLLNHLNLFGESYGSQVDRVLRRYVGLG
jgi:fructosamine-3-kinase